MYLLNKSLHFFQKLLKCSVYIAHIWGIQFLFNFLLFIDTFHNWNVYWNWFCNHLYLKSKFFAFHLSYWMYCFSEFVTALWNVLLCETCMWYWLVTQPQNSEILGSHVLSFSLTLPLFPSISPRRFLLPEFLPYAGIFHERGQPGLATHSSVNRVLAGMFPLQRYWSFLILDGLGTHWRLCQGWNFPKMFV